MGKNWDGTFTVYLGGAHAYRVKVRPVDGVPRVLSLFVGPAVEADGKTLRDGRTVNDVIITSEVLRGIPVQRIAEAVAKLRAGEISEAFQRARMPADGRDRGEDHYRAVARIAELAKENGEPARKAIAQQWSVSPGTADLWIRRAKDYGFLRRDLRQPRRRDQ